MTSPADREARVGVVRRPHGVRGELAFFPEYDGDPSRLVGLELRPVPPVEGFPERVACESVRGGGERWILRLAGISDPDSARRFAGRALWARESDLPPSEEATPYHFELVGLEVVTSGGEPIGHVRRIESTPAGDLLVLDEEGMVLIPFRPMVVEIDREAGRIVVDLPAGLLDVNLPKRPR